jgi:hypothetical protein
VASASVSSSSRSTVEISSAAARVPGARIIVAHGYVSGDVSALAFAGGNRLLVGEPTGQVYAFTVKPAIRDLGTNGEEFMPADGSSVGA